MLKVKGFDNMQSKPEPIPFNGLFFDFKEIYYSIIETEWSIQILEDVINRLKLLHDGYLQDMELEKIISELETFNQHLIEDKTTSRGELFEIETKLISGKPGNLIEGG